MGVKLFKIWWLMAKAACQSQLTKPAAGVVYVAGKLTRFFLLLVFLFSVFSAAGKMASYTRAEVILFFLGFVAIDATVQFLFRGVYHFHFWVVSGNFDFELLRPYPSWFRPLFGWTDLFDLVTLPLFWGIFFWWLEKNNWLTLPAVFYFIFCLLASLLLAGALHLLTCAICILTTKIDHLIWIYRDLTALTRFPPEIYPRWLQLVLTFVVPAVVIISFPVKAWLGRLGGVVLVLVIILTLLFIWGVGQFWRYALTRYTSASS